MTITATTTAPALLRQIEARLPIAARAMAAREQADPAMVPAVARAAADLAMGVLAAGIPAADMAAIAGVAATSASALRMEKGVPASV
jgi:hypothetical protein